MIYLASPYSDNNMHTRNLRFRAALRAAASLMDRGDLVISPIVYGHIAEQKMEQQWPYQYWMDWSKNMLSHCTRLYVLTIPGWRDSKGVEVEVKLAVELSKPVVGYAHGADAEDISGFDILGEFGLTVRQSRPVFKATPEDGKD